MDLTALPLPPEIWAATPAAAQALIVSLEARVRELEGRLRQDSSNSSRPPSADPPQAPVRPKAPPSGRRRGGQPGHRGAFRALLSVEQLDEVVVVVPEVCRHCEKPLPELAALWRTRVWRHQVVELLPLAVRVTEYQNGPAVLPGLWEAHPSGDPGRGAATAVRGAPDGGDRAAERSLSLKPAGSAAIAAGSVAGACVPGRGGAPGAGAERRAGTRRRGSPNCSPAGGRSQHGQDRLVAGAEAGLAVDG